MGYIVLLVCVVDRCLLLMFLYECVWCVLYGLRGCFECYLGVSGLLCEFSSGWLLVARVVLIYYWLWLRVAGCCIVATRVVFIL